MAGPLDATDRTVPGASGVRAISVPAFVLRTEDFGPASSARCRRAMYGSAQGRSVETMVRGMRPGTMGR